MTTILNINSTDDGALSLTKIQANFANINTNKSEIAYVDSEVAKKPNTPLVVLLA